MEVMSSDCDMNVVKTECNESLSNGMQAKQCETPRPSSFLVEFNEINGINWISFNFNQRKAGVLPKLWMYELWEAMQGAMNSIHGV